MISHVLNFILTNGTWRNLFIQWQSTWTNQFVKRAGLLYMDKKLANVCQQRRNQPTAAVDNKLEKRRIRPHARTKKKNTRAIAGKSAVQEDTGR